MYFIARTRLRITIIIMPMVREAAEARVHSMCFGYLDSGGDDEVILLYVIVIVIVIVMVIVITIVIIIIECF